LNVERRGATTEPPRRSAGGAECPRRALVFHRNIRRLLARTCGVTARLNICPLSWNVSNVVMFCLWPQALFSEHRREEWDSVKARLASLNSPLVGLGAKNGTRSQPSIIQSNVFKPRNGPRGECKAPRRPSGKRKRFAQWA